MDDIYDFDEYRDQLELSLGVPFAEGNRIEVLQNGDEIFPAMLSAIENAADKIDFVTYVYWGGDIARQFASALARKAAAGVTVRVLLDAFGAKKMPGELVARLEESGADVRWFRPLATWRVWRNDKRTHRKILVIDDKLAFTGGVGIAEEWSGDARNPNEWRETHFSLTGPSVRGLKAAFLDNWNEAGEWSWEGRCPLPEAQDGGIPVQIVRASSTVGWTNTAALLRSLVSLSKRTLTIVTPYFVPDERLRTLLCTAAERGVTVKVMIPGKHCDMQLPKLAGQVSIASLLDCGVRIWRYDRTNLHAKLILVDGVMACIGSANLNHRSMGKDEECCAVMLSPVITQELQARFDDDCRHAELIEPERWQQRGLGTRALERLARLLVEQL